MEKDPDKNVTERTIAVRQRTRGSVTAHVCAHAEPCARHTRQAARPGAAGSTYLGGVWAYCYHGAAVFGTISICSAGSAAAIYELARPSSLRTMLQPCAIELAL